MAVVECTFERQALSVFARAVYGGTIINPWVDLLTIRHVRVRGMTTYIVQLEVNGSVRWFW